MILIVLLFCFLLVGVLLFKRTLKILFIVLAILFGMGVYFLHGIGIEDYYGRNNHIYFEGKEGDTVVMVNNQTQQPIGTGQIQRKTWNRVFIVSEKDTLDLMDWIEKEAGYMAEVDCKLKQK